MTLKATEEHNYAMEKLRDLRKNFQIFKSYYNLDFRFYGQLLALF